MQPQEAHSEAHLNRHPIPAPSGVTTGRILLADDESTSRETLAEVLREEGYEIALRKRRTGW